MGAMKSNDTSFHTLIDRVRSGNEEAAKELVDTYGASLQRAVRRTLNRRLRRQFDSLDFVQLAWSSVFRVRDGLDRFETPEQLTAFLVKLARNKVCEETRRRLMTEKYNVNRELPLSALKTEEEPTVAGEGEPMEMAMAREQLEHLVKDKWPRHRRIVELRLEGLGNGEIAERLQIAPSTVRRVLDRLYDERIA